MNEKLLKQIKYFRKQKNISLKELAKKTNISYSYLYLLEKGKRKNPSLKTIRKIANALNIKLIFILTEEN